MIDISANGTNIQITDETGRKTNIYKDDIRFLTTDFVVIKYQTDSELISIPQQLPANISVSGVACVSVADFIAKIGVLINFNF